MSKIWDVLEEFNENNPELFDDFLASVEAEMDSRKNQTFVMAVLLQVIICEVVLVLLTSVIPIPDAFAVAAGCGILMFRRMHFETSFRVESIIMIDLLRARGYLDSDNRLRL